MEKEDHSTKIKMEEETSCMLIVSEDDTLAVGKANDLQILVIQIKEQVKNIILQLRLTMTIYVVQQSFLELTLQALRWQRASFRCLSMIKKSLGKMSIIYQKAESFPSMQIWGRARN